MAATLAQQAAQAASQGQAAYNSDVSNANNYNSQYQSDVGNTNNAANQVTNYTNYMAGAGSAGNQYNSELGTQENELGYDPAQMTAARSNLNQSTGALSAYSDFANTAASKFGMNAGGFAAANSGALSGLNNNIASNQNVVNGLSTLYGQAQTGANQYAGLQVQGEQNTLAGYQDAYTNAYNTMQSALSMAQFYTQMASTQGVNNAQQQQYYAAATQAYAAATQAEAQANELGKQAALLQSQTTGQNIQNTGAQNTLNQDQAKQQAAQAAAASKNAAAYYKSQGMVPAGTDYSSGSPVTVYAAQF